MYTCTIAFGAPLTASNVFTDNMLSGLGQYLDGHILRNEILLDQGAQEIHILSQRLPENLPRSL